jgi:hypothetical protein
MSFDAWVVGFGLSRVLIELVLVPSPWAYGVLALTIAIDVYLLSLFFRRRRTASSPPPNPPSRRFDGPPDHRVGEDVAEAKLFGPLGYIIAAAAVAVLLSTIIL